jgi:hypothetical protein
LQSRWRSRDPLAAQATLSEPIPTMPTTSVVGVSTRTYIVLAGLTGLVILAAFAVQLVRS